MSNAIRVMIVDDSIFFRAMMSSSLTKHPEIEVVGLASSAVEAQQKVASLKPDVIVLDIEMPHMRGPEFLKVIRPRYPHIQVIAISSNPDNVFEALRNGAMDFVPKPNVQSNLGREAFVEQTVGKIKIAAESRRTKAPELAPTVKAAPVLPKLPMPTTVGIKSSKTVIAVGASTGGTEAIATLLRGLPPDMPGMIIVQHMPPVFTRMFAERLDRDCKLSVREAADGDRVETGTVLIAPGDKHMRLMRDSRGYYVQCRAGENVSGHCPSVDALFLSVAQTAGANAIGVILTGMGQDGAKGMLEMKRSGAFTFGQDQASSVIYGMPMVAYNLGGVCEQRSIDEMPHALVHHLNKKS